jgi:hypothetical protein
LAEVRAPAKESVSTRSGEIAAVAMAMAAVAATAAVAVALVMVVVAAAADTAVATATEGPTVSVAERLQAAAWGPKGAVAAWVGASMGVAQAAAGVAVASGAGAEEGAKAAEAAAAAAWKPPDAHQPRQHQAVSPWHSPGGRA